LRSFVVLRNPRRASHGQGVRLSARAHVLLPGPDGLLWAERPVARLARRSGRAGRGFVTGQRAGRSHGEVRRYTRLPTLQTASSS